jgi:prepilin-type N-terminal cleavage/methylation domain-containing protein
MKPCKGFTLIETMVAITVLLVSLAGPLTIATKGLSAAVFARDQITAFYLAQEAVEFIRNRRDEFGLQANSTGFASAFSSCFSGVCRVDISNSSVTACTGSCPVLRYNQTTGFYNYVSGTNSRFTRNISFRSLSSFETEVRVTINWTSGLVGKSFSIQENLLDWQL